MVRYHGSLGGCRLDSGASTLALLSTVEAIRIALAAAVVELVAGVGAGVVVPLAERAAARAHHSRQDANVLRLAAAALALLTVGKAVLVAAASSEDELLANAVRSVVVPMQLRLVAFALILGKEAELCNNKTTLYQYLTITVHS